MSNDELSVAVFNYQHQMIKKNIETIEQLLTSEQSKSADFILPECCNFRRLKEPLAVESIPGPTTIALLH